MITNPERVQILYIGSASDSLKIDDPNGRYDVDMHHTPDALDRLYQASYNAIVVEKALFTDDLQQTLTEIRRRFPFMIVILLSDDTDTAESLPSDTYDEIVSQELSPDAWQKLLSSCLRQQKQKTLLHQHNLKLQASTQIAQQLYFAEDPRSLIRQAIETCCSGLDLQYMAVLLDDGEQMRLYAGSSTAASMYESNVHLDTYNPLQRSFDTGAGQVYDDIQLDPYYEAISVLPESASVIIVPLYYRDIIIGVMATFNQPGEKFHSDDLIIHELFASHLAAAYQNVRNLYAQHADFEFAQHLLRAWQRFSRADALGVIADVLIEIIEDVSIVKQVAVWLYSGPDQNDAITRAHDVPTRLLIEQMIENGSIDQLFAETGDQVYLRMRTRRDMFIRQLAMAMTAQELLMFPISYSSRLAGGMIVGLSGTYRFSVDNVNLIRSLANIAGQSAERVLLNMANQEKSGQLEAILRSITDGILFVNPLGTVAYCNTQFSEITGINRSDIMERDRQHVLEQLAALTTHPDETYKMMEEAVNRLHTTSGSEAYPIVELQFKHEKQTQYVEFALLDHENEYTGWAGFVRNLAVRPAAVPDTGRLLHTIADYMHQPYEEILSAVEDVSDIIGEDYQHIVAHIQDHASSLFHVWDSFVELYEVETGSASLQHNHLSLSRFLEDSTAGLQVDGEIFVMDLTEPEAAIAINNRRVREAARFLIRSILEMSSMPVRTEVEYHPHEVHLIMDQVQIPFTAEQFSTLLNAPYNEVDQVVGDDGIHPLLYISANILRVNGSRVFAWDTSGRAIQVVLSLPILESMEDREPELQSVVDPVKADEDSQAVSAPSRTMRTIMVIRGSSQLIAQVTQQLELDDIDVLIYDDSQMALRDMHMIRLDLILIDHHLVNGDGASLCESMRQQTETPIIILADEISDTEKVRAFKSGADDYITSPVTVDEIMMRLMVIFNRQTIADRTREPLELGDLKIDFARRQVFLKGEPIMLTRIEYDLLHVLANNMGQVLTHEQILKHVWGPEYRAEKQYLWVNVSRLRKKLEPHPDSERYIYNESGVGYVFTLMSTTTS